MNLFKGLCKLLISIIIYYSAYVYGMQIAGNNFLNLIEATNQYNRELILSKDNFLYPDKKFEIRNTIMNNLSVIATDLLLTHLLSKDDFDLISNQQEKDLTPNIIENLKKSCFKAYLQQSPDELCSRLGAVFDKSIAINRIGFPEAKNAENVLSSIIDSYKKDIVFLTDYLKDQTKNKKNKAFIDESLQKLDKLKNFDNEKEVKRIQRVILGVCKKVLRQDTPSLKITDPMAQSRMAQSSFPETLMTSGFHEDIAEKAKSAEEVERIVNTIITNLKKLSTSEFPDYKDKARESVEEFIRFISKQENITVGLTHKRLLELKKISNFINKSDKSISQSQVKGFIKNIRAIKNMTIRKINTPEESLASSAIEYEEEIKKLDQEQEKKLLHEIIYQHKQYKKSQKKPMLEWLIQQEYLLEEYIQIKQNQDLTQQEEVNLARYQKELINIKKAIEKDRLKTETAKLFAIIKEKTTQGLLPDIKDLESYLLILQKLEMLKPLQGRKEIIETLEQKIKSLKSKFEQASLEELSRASIFDIHERLRDFPPLKNDKFITFHVLVNQYEKAMAEDPRNKTNEAFLLNAIKLLKEDRQLGNIFPVFIQLSDVEAPRATPQMNLDQFKGPDKSINIEKLKEHVNKKYFEMFSQDKCKSIPYLLQKIKNYDQYAKNTVKSILAGMRTQYQSAFIFNAVEKVLDAEWSKEFSFAAEESSNEEKMRAILSLLDQACRNKTFKEVRFLETDQYDEKIKGIAKNLSAVPLQDVKEINQYIKELSRLYEAAPIEEIASEEGSYGSVEEASSSSSEEPVEKVLSAGGQQPEVLPTTIVEPSVGESAAPSFISPTPEFVQPSEVEKEPSEEPIEPMVIQPVLPATSPISLTAESEIKEEFESQSEKRDIDALILQWVLKDPMKKELSFEELALEEKKIENYLIKEDMPLRKNGKKALHFIKLERIKKIPLNRLNNEVVQPILQGTLSLDDLSQDELLAYQASLNRSKDRDIKMALDKVNTRLRFVMFESLMKKVIDESNKEIEKSQSQNILESSLIDALNMSSLTLKPGPFSDYVNMFLRHIINIGENIEKIENPNQFVSYILALATHPLLDEESENSLINIFPKEAFATNLSFQVFKEACQKINNKVTGFPVPKGEIPQTTVIEGPAEKPSAPIVPITEEEGGSPVPQPSIAKPKEEPAKVVTITPVEMPTEKPTEVQGGGVAQPEAKPILPSGLFSVIGDALNWIGNVFSRLGNFLRSFLPW